MQDVKLTFAVYNQAQMAFPKMCK